MLYQQTNFKNLKSARDKFIAHFDLNANDKETQGYIETLYSTFNELIKDFNKKYNKPPYNLYINLDEYYYNLPTPHTICDESFKHILQLINSYYERYINTSNIGN